jgi:hypothetical protein
MISKLLDYDELTGLKTIHHYDPLTNQTHIEYVQDVQKSIDATKALAGTDYQKNGAKQSFMHAAHIPPIIELKLKKEHNIDIYKSEDWPRLRRLLNGEYKYLKMGDYKL